jgi:hypothetical protein
VSKLALALATSQRRTAARCSIAKLLESLDPDDRGALLEAFDSDTETTQIERALSAAGLSVGSGAVGRHRRGDCRCEAQ